MRHEQLALVQGMADTRAALRRWREAPLRVLSGWTALSLAIAVGLLAATWLVATLSRPDPTLLEIAGVHRAPQFADFTHYVARNSLVLALHALACVAGFMARSSLPVVAEGHSGLLRAIHDRAGTAAVGFVICATTFSLVTQALVLGRDTATFAHQLGISPYELLAILSVHALPELVALFLPLAAWTLAARAGRWNELLAATAVTVAVAIPVMVAAAAVEAWLTPRLLAAV